jgi:hypothetical protein
MTAKGMLLPIDQLKVESARLGIGINFFISRLHIEVKPSCKGTNQAPDDNTVYSQNIAVKEGLNVKAARL